MDRVDQPDRRTGTRQGGAEHLERLVAGERRERQLVPAPFPVELRQPGAQGRLGVLGPVRHHQQEWTPSRAKIAATDEEAEEIQAGIVGPVEVFHDQAGWRIGRPRGLLEGRAEQAAGQCEEELVAFLVQVQLGHGIGIPSWRGHQVRQQGCKLAGKRPDGRSTGRLTHTIQADAERVDDRRKRAGSILWKARAREHPDATGAGVGHHLGDQARLAKPGLTGDQDDATLAATANQLIDCLAQARERAVTPNELRTHERTVDQPRPASRSVMGMVVHSTLLRIQDSALVERVDARLTIIEADLGDGPTPGGLEARD
jgi:hypothetical protein